MLLGPILHPEILRGLGSAGHGAKVLIADGNYPLATRSSQAATRVYLNLAPGKVSVPDVLESIVACTPIEAADVMTPDDGSEPSIFAEFRAILAHSTTAMPLHEGSMPLPVGLLRHGPCSRRRISYCDRRTAGLRKHLAHHRGSRSGRVR